MDWINLATIVGTGASLAGFMHTIIRNFRKDMDERFDKLDKRCDNLDEKIERQSSRTDKLYEMFIDLLKERK